MQDKILVRINKSENEIMKYNYNKNTVYVLLLMLFITLPASAKDKREQQLENKSTTLTFEDFTPSNVVIEGNFSKASATTVLSADKKYRVTLYSNVFPIPMQKIHTWTARIEQENDKPLEKAKIYIHGGMPVHRHGFPVTPRVRKYLGDGKFLIEGVKFSMIGDWEMRLNIKEKTVRDRAIFKIKIAP